MLGLLKNRLTIQFIALFVTNPYLSNFITGDIYQGPLKKFCVPSLNCYSCPAAVGACPMGIIQNSIADPFYKLSFIAVGLLLFLGATFGRIVCGKLCPFGLFQDLLHKIPSKKIKLERSLPKVHRILLNGKVFSLLVYVIGWTLLDRLLHGYGTPMFCKFICPSGTLMAGIPLAIANSDIRALIGLTFTWKTMILVVITAISVKLSRPFCKYICPLGLSYGVLNPISFYRIHLDEESCVNCGICTDICPMAVSVPKNGNTIECIRCGDCEKACPHNAIKCGFSSFNDMKNRKKKGLI